MRVTLASYRKFLSAGKVDLEWFRKFRAANNSARLGMFRLRMRS